jgi:hypothetical protein
LDLSLILLLFAPLKKLPEKHRVTIWNVFPKLGKSSVYFPEGKMSMALAKCRKAQDSSCTFYFNREPHPPMFFYCLQSRGWSLFLKSFSTKVFFVFIKTHITLCLLSAKMHFVLCI